MSRKSSLKKAKKDTEIIIIDLNDEEDAVVEIPLCRRLRSSSRGEIQIPVATKTPTSRKRVLPTQTHGSSTVKLAPIFTKKSQTKDKVILIEEIDVESNSSGSSSSVQCIHEDAQDTGRSSRKKRKPTKTFPNKSSPFKLAPIFVRKTEVAAKKSLTIATRDFLCSGLPEVTIRARKAIEKQRAEMDLFDNMVLFPVLTHNVSLDTWDPVRSINFQLSPFWIQSEVLDHTCKIRKDFPYNKEDPVDTSRLGIFCCGVNHWEQSPSLTKTLNLTRKRQQDSIPWILKYQLRRSKYMVMADETKKRFKKWLKQWHHDIQDDGGTSRKILEKKRKRGNGELDFIDSGDSEVDEDMRNKSVILSGPTGSGKTAMVYSIAEALGFKVAEINFSSRRSGQEVLRSVEEATLSRRLSNSIAIDDAHCLLLVKDVDQLFPEEDEGFFAALAQLITSSCRPIVMTLSPSHADPVLDSRIEKKDSLWFTIALPLPDDIVTKILLPIIRKEIRSVKHPKRKIKSKDEKSLHTILSSIVRHSDCDIKKSINQTQLLWMTTSFTMADVHRSLNPNINLDLVIEDSPAKAERKKLATSTEEMYQISGCLEFLSNLDIMRSSSKFNHSEYDGILHSYNEDYYTSNLVPILQKYEESLSDKIGAMRSIVLETDRMLVDTENAWKRTEVCREYCNNFGGNWEDISYVRTIVKQGMLNSISTNRRNGRIHRYLSMSLNDRDVIGNCFDFPKTLELVRTCN